MLKCKFAVLFTNADTAISNLWQLPTALVIMFMASGLVYLNLFGHTLYRSVIYCGFPFVCYESRVYATGWLSTWHWFAMFADLAFAIAILIGGAVMFEGLMRRRSPAERNNG